MRKIKRLIINSLAYCLVYCFRLHSSLYKPPSKGKYSVQSIYNFHFRRISDCLWWRRWWWHAYSWCKPSYSPPVTEELVTGPPGPLGEQSEASMPPAQLELTVIEERIETPVVSYPTEVNDDVVPPVSTGIGIKDGTTSVANIKTVGVNSDQSTSSSLVREGTTITYSGTTYNFPDEPVAGTGTSISTPIDSTSVSFLLDEQGKYASNSILLRNSSPSDDARGQFYYFDDVLFISNSLPKNITPEGAVPQSAVTYHGRIAGVAQLDSSARPDITNIFHADFAMTVDFASSTSTKSISGKVFQSGRDTVYGKLVGGHNGNAFRANYVVTNESRQPANIDITGNFYGPSAEEIAGSGTGSYGENGGTATLNLLGARPTSPSLEN